MAEKSGTMNRAFETNALGLQLLTGGLSAGAVFWAGSRREQDGKLPEGGVYLLILKLGTSRRIGVGALGKRTFAAGWYLYTGSAQRGLKSRLGRHARRTKSRRWHIDYLTPHAELIGAMAWKTPRATECLVADRVGRIPGVTAPAAGFGSSDCACFSHLHHFSGSALVGRARTAS